MRVKKLSISELYKLITGIWENDNYRFIFNGENNEEGTVTVFNKKTKFDFGVNFRIVAKDTIAKLQFINKNQINPYFEDFPVFSLNGDHLKIQNQEVAITVNKVA